MLTAEFVENAIRRLSPEELTKFWRWYAEFDADLWSAKIKADFAASKLDRKPKKLIKYYMEL